MINNQPNELTLIYHSQKMDDKKALAFVNSLDNYTVKSLDVAKDNITATQLAEVADKLHGNIRDLLDKSFQSKPGIDSVYDGYEDEELLKILTTERILIATPIVIIGDCAYQYGTAYDLVKKEL